MRFTCLRTTAPSIPTHVANIDILHVQQIIFNINNITFCSSAITWTIPLWTFDVLHVRQSRILPGEFVQENTISLARTLLNKCLYKKTSALLLLFNTTRQTFPNKLPIWLQAHDIHILACRTDFHTCVLYTLFL